MFKIKGNIVSCINDAVLYKWKVKKLSDVRRKVLCVFFSIFSKKMLKKTAYKIMVSENSKECDYFISYCGSYSLFKETHLKKSFLPVDTGKFENMPISIPNNYHEILSKIYGDYMKLPPEEKRVNHAMVDIVFDLKNK